MLVNPFTMPGMGDPTLSTEREFLWNALPFVMYNSGVILSTTTDATNTTTTQLRPGLLLGKITATDKLGAYSSTATDGRNVVYGVLSFPVNMLNFTSGSAEDRPAQVVIGGPVKAAQLIGLDYAARRQMAHRFVFDDDFTGAEGLRATVAKTADYTVLAADHGTMFTTGGAVAAVNFTLPALANVTAGWEATFFAEADYSLTVTAPANVLVAFNDATATSIAFSTAGEIVGSGVKIRVNAAGTKYIALPILGNDAATPTIA